MLRHPKWQQVGVAKSIYANIEFRGGEGIIFSNIDYNACLIYTSWKSWASYPSLSWGTVGCLRGKFFFHLRSTSWPYSSHPPCIVLASSLGESGGGFRSSKAIRRIHASRLEARHRNLEGQVCSIPHCFIHIQGWPASRCDCEDLDAAVDVFELTRTGPKPTKLEPEPAKPNQITRTETDKSNHIATQI